MSPNLVLSRLKKTCSWSETSGRLDTVQISRDDNVVFSSVSFMYLSVKTILKGIPVTLNLKYINYTVFIIKILVKFYIFGKNRTPDMSLSITRSKPVTLDQTTNYEISFYNVKSICFYLKLNLNSNLRQKRIIMKPTYELERLERKGVDILPLLLE